VKRCLNIGEAGVESFGASQGLRSVPRP
jgi:hypothetical protein